MTQKASTLFHQLLDRNLDVPESLFVLIGKEQGQEAETAAREWYACVRRSRQQE